MFWFCLLNKFAPIHTKTDNCRLKCSSGVEGKVQIEKKRRTKPCWLKCSFEVEGILQISHSIDVKYVHTMGKFNEQKTLSYLIFIHTAMSTYFVKLLILLFLLLS